MSDPTLVVYEARAADWRREREGSISTAEAEAFAAEVRARREGPIVDVGCGPGWHVGALGSSAIALDGARSMLEQVPDFAPGTPRVQADLTALPFRRAALAGALASKSYVHLPRTSVPLALADLHRTLAVGAPVELVLFGGDREHGPWPDDEFAGRLFSLWPADRLRDVLVGAGFGIDSFQGAENTGDGRRYRIRATRLHTLADTVGADMRLLVCGLNPSLYAADRGVGYARPGNRFWPAALAAGLVTVDRDPVHALRHHGLGLTDLAKRATTASSELTADEYGGGLARVERLVEWLKPRAVCIVGLEGWRAAVDRKARAGIQPDGLAGRPVYVMPSTSGLNAHSRLADLTDHLRRAAALADEAA